MCKAISVSTNKGGTLKTSICVSLGSLLSKLGKKVLIVDTDNQGNVLLSFGKNPDELDYSVYDALLENVDVEETIINVAEGLDVLPSNDDMDLFEFDVLTNIDDYPNPFSLLRNQIDRVRSEYDYIIIDTPPSLGLIQGNVLSAVDEVLIPFHPEVYSMRSLVKILESVEAFKMEHNPKLEVVGVVGTLVDKRTNLHRDIMEQAEDYCKLNDIKMLDTVIPRTIAYASSIAYDGLPLSLKNDLKLNKINKLIAKEKQAEKDAYINLMGEILND